MQLLFRRHIFVRIFREESCDENSKQWWQIHFLAIWYSVASPSDIAAWGQVLDLNDLLRDDWMSISVADSSMIPFKTFLLRVYISRRRFEAGSAVFIFSAAWLESGSIAGWLVNNSAYAALKIMLMMWTMPCVLKRHQIFMLRHENLVVIFISQKVFPKTARNGSMTRLTWKTKKWQINVAQNVRMLRGSQISFG